MNPAAVDFGDVLIGTTITQQIVITNRGNDDITLSNQTLSGAGFSVTGLAFPTTLMPAQSLMATLSFSPTASGAVSGSFILNTTEPGLSATLTMQGNGLSSTQQLAVSPASIDFGSLPVGSTNTQTVTLSNTGNTNFTLNTATLTGAQFSTAGLVVPTTLVPGQTISFTITFAPTAGGAVLGNLSIATTLPNSPTVISLAGTGVNQVLQLQLNPLTFDFGSVIVGSTVTQPILATNTGNTSITITASSATGTGFGVTGLALPLTLAAGQTTTFNVQFAPTAAGAVAGNVALVSNAANSPTTASLTGTGVAQVQTLATNPATIDFGDLTVGSSASQMVTVSNTGNTAVTVTSAVATGAGFSITPPLAVPVTLNPGQSTNFTVVFTPGAAGAVNGNATLLSNATNSPHVVTLAGNGVTQIQTLSLNPTSADFGDVFVGNSASQPVTVTNTGNAPVTITSATAAGAGFSITPPLAVPVTLNPGQSTNFTVVFAPGAAGAVNGNATLLSNATNSPHVVTLAGNGVTQVLQLGVNPTMINFGDVQVGINSSVTGMITNIGNVNLTVTAANVTGAGFSISPPLALPLALTPGQSASFTAVFAPGAAGAVNGSISFVSNAANSPTAVTLQGNAVAAPTGMLDLNPMNVDYGSVVVGSFQDAIIVARNSGVATVTITAAGTTGAGFSITPAPVLPIVLTPGQTSNFTVRFAPGGTGAAAGTFTLTSDAVNPTATATLAGTGIASTKILTLNPASLNFGDVAVGGNANQMVSMTNTGNTALTVTAANVTGAAFSITPALGVPVVLNPGQSTTFNVRFAPAATGVQAGNVSLVSDASNSPTVISLSGNGTAVPTGTLTPSPSTVSFGSVIIGNTANQTIQLQNTGTANLSITSATTTGAGYSISGLTLPLALTPGQTSSFTATFAPASAGAVAGNIQLVSNASNSPTNISLSGTGVAQALTLSANPVSIAFGDVPLGGTQSQSVTVTNTGNSTITISSSAVAGAGFSVTGLTTPLNLSAGQSTLFTVVFSPAVAGNVNGSVSLTSNASNSPTVVTVSGNGVAPLATLSTNPASIDFGDVTIGTSSSQTVTVTNTGNVNINVSASSVTGAGFSTAGLSTPVALTPGQQISFSVVFTPGATGTTSGSTTLTSNASNSPTSIALQGNGTTQAAQLTINPVSIDFGSVVLGGNRSQMVTLTNTGSAGVTITSSTISDPTIISTSGLSLPLSLNAGQTTTFTVAFAPNVVGSVSGSVTLISSAPNSPSVLTISGSGIVGATVLWNPSLSVGAVGYNVYRASISGGPYTKLNTTPVILTSFPDLTVPVGQTSFYIVRAVDASGVESVDSNEALIFVAP